MSISAMILGEFDQESVSTRRLLERVPEASWDWKPHEKSMALGRLVGHTAEIFGWAAGMLADDTLDMASYAPQPTDNLEQVLALYDSGTASFREAFSKADESTFFDTWSLKNGDETLFAAPRLPAIRAFVLNHLIHHRGQLTVYLRMLDVALPQVYGPTADEPSF